MDTIWLEETADAYIALPGTIEPDLDGYLITDVQQAHVFRYMATGELAQVYGSEGEGPGEFENSSVALPYDDENIAVVTWEPRALNLFQRQSGEYVDRYPLQSVVESAVLSGDTAWFGGIRYSQHAGVERLRLGHDESTFMAPLPESYVSKGPVGGIFGRVSLVRWADTLMVGYEPTNCVLVLDPFGEVVESIEIPRRERRGVPRDLEPALADAMSETYYEVFGVLSAMRYMHRLPNGTTALVYYDHRPEPPPVSSDVFLTVLSADRRRACVDARIELGPDPHPVVGFKADTLLVMEQQVGAGIDVSVFVARYTISVSRCRWLATTSSER